MTTFQAQSQEKVNNFIQRSIAAIEQGFKSNAAKKDALDNLNRAYDLLARGFVADAILNMRNADKELDEYWNGWYWGIPRSLHNWKESWGREFLSAVPNLESIIIQINELYALRQEIKSVEVNRPAPKPVNEFEIKVQRSIKDELEKMKSDYAYGMKFHELFGNLPVSINAHWVVNQFGTEFIRCFYYLAGKITKLSVIIALMQDIESKKKAQQR